MPLHIGGGERGVVDGHVVDDGLVGARAEVERVGGVGQGTGDRGGDGVLAVDVEGHGGGVAGGNDVVPPAGGQHGRRGDAGDAATAPPFEAHLAGRGADPAGHPTGRGYRDVPAFRGAAAVLADDAPVRAVEGEGARLYPRLGGERAKAGELLVVAEGHHGRGTGGADRGVAVAGTAGGAERVAGGIGTGDRALAVGRAGARRLTETPVTLQAAGGHDGLPVRAPRLADHIHRPVVEGPVGVHLVGGHQQADPAVAVHITDRRESLPEVVVVVDAAAPVRLRAQLPRAEGSV